MDDTKTVRAKVVRDFNDAGLERRFVKGQIMELPEGTFENYRAANLVEVAVEEPAPAEQPTTGARRH